MVDHLEFDVVIPARYESSRLPGKLLADICGKTMIQRVVERAMTSAAKTVIVAVDDDRIGEHVADKTAATVVSTASDHASGSDRIAEAVSLLDLPGERTIVNVQGDEPLICAELINQVAATLHNDSSASMGTAATPMDLDAHGDDPNRVKCVVDRYSRALYFSRSVIPWAGRSVTGSDLKGLHHIGIYAYTVNYLVHQHASREVCDLEKNEGLEQLRALYYGDTIAVHVTDNYDGIGVDTSEDLDRVRAVIANSSDFI